MEHLQCTGRGHGRLRPGVLRGHSPWSFSEGLPDDDIGRVLLPHGGAVGAGLATRAKAKKNVS